MNRKILSVIGIMGLWLSGVLATLAIYTAITYDVMLTILYLMAFFITTLISYVLIAIGRKNDDIWWEE